MHNDIISLISNDRAFEAIQLLKKRLKGRSKLNALANIESRLNNLNSRIARGVVAPEAATLERNQIRDSLLELIRPSAPAQTQKASRLPLVLMGIGGLLISLMAAFYFLGSDKTPPPVTCTKHRTAIRVANFLDQGTATADPFSSSIITIALDSFGTENYDISSIGIQAREANYQASMIEKYFNRQTTCDTSGVLLNGVLSPEHNVFNIWITLANLALHAPELQGRSELTLSNPPNVELSMPEDALFVVNFLCAILLNAEGKPYEALKKIVAMEKKYNKLIAANPALKANIAFVKGNAYALRGDKERANAQYDIAAKNGSSDLATAAIANKTTADRMYLVMIQDPKTREIVLANQRQHRTFEQELARFFRNIGRVIDGLFGGRRKLGI